MSQATRPAARCAPPQLGSGVAQLGQHRSEVASGRNSKHEVKASNLLTPTPVGPLGQWLVKHHFTPDLACDIERETRAIASKRLPPPQQRALLDQVARKVARAAETP